MIFLQDGNLSRCSVIALDSPGIADALWFDQTVVCLMVVGTGKSVDGTPLLRHTLRDRLCGLVADRRRVIQPMGEE